MAASLDLLQGTLDLLVLKALSWDARHGYAVATWIRERSHEAFLVEEGALYPALHRLERRGWVESEWGLSDNNRKAKYYRLTSRGRVSTPCGSFTLGTLCERGRHPLADCRAIGGIVANFRRLFRLSGREPEPAEDIAAEFEAHLQFKADALAREGMFAVRRTAGGQASLRTDVPLCRGVPGH